MTIELSRTAPSALAGLQELEAKAGNEIARIESLESAACDASELAQIADELRGVGLNIDSPVELRESELRPPFAWLLTGCKADPAGSRQG
jgi:hypothetical protein